MGQVKQLLPWGNKTLLEHHIMTLLQTDRRVIVVVGANHDLIVPVIKEMNISIVFNREWEQGMGRSIAAGIENIRNSYPEADSALITLPDQPLIPANHYRNMINEFCPGEEMVVVSVTASGYEGVPVLFDRYYFSELEKLTGNQGARIVFQQHRSKLRFVRCDEITNDIDTPESYQNLLNRLNFSS